MSLLRQGQKILEQVINISTDFLIWVHLFVKFGTGSSLPPAFPP